VFTDGKTVVIITFIDTLHIWMAAVNVSNPYTSRRALKRQTYHNLYNSYQTGLPETH